MGQRNKKVDDYIANANEFARPIMQKLRDIAHKACPELEEDIKWNVPFFVYKGPVLGMSAHTKHISFGFYKVKLMDDPDGLFDDVKNPNVCTLKASTVKDLPSQKVLAKYFKQAVKLNEEGKKLPVRTGDKSRPPEVPKDLAVALKKNAKAKKVYDSFPPSAQRDYTLWILGAKKQETRDKRIATTIEWLSEGKKRNWKYQQK